MQLYNVFTPDKSSSELKTLYVHERILSVDIDFLIFIYRYFVFKYGGFNLHDAIKANRPFLETQIRLIIYSMLRGLKVRTLPIQFDVYVKQYFPASFSTI